MKTKVAYILIIAGAMGLVGQTHFRVQREKQILEAQVWAQQATLVYSVLDSGVVKIKMR